MINQIEQLTTLLETLTDPYKRLNLLLQLADLYQQQNQPQLQSTLHEALTLAETVQQEYLQATCHKKLAQYYKNQAHFEEALHHCEKYHYLKEDATLLDDNQPLQWQVEQVKREAETYRLKTTSLEQEIAARRVQEVALTQHRDLLKDLVEQRTHRLQQQLDIIQQTEMRLMDERTLLRTLIDSLPNLIYVKDLTGRFLIGNRAMIEHVGLQSEAELLGKTDAHLYPPHLVERFTALDQEALQNGFLHHSDEELLLNAKGEQVWFLMTRTPLQDSQGNIIGLVGVGRNITHYKQVEAEQRRISQQVRQSKKLLFSVIDSTPDFIFARGRDGRYLVANRTFAELLQTTPQQMIYYSDAELWDSATLASFVQKFHEDDDKAFAGEIIRNPNHEIEGRNGQTYILDTYKIPLYDDYKEIFGVLTLSRDVTKRTRVEHWLESLYEISQNLNHARTDEELLLALAKPAIVNGAIAAQLYYIDLDEVGNFQWLELAAQYWQQSTEPFLQVGTYFHIPTYSFLELWLNNPDTPLAISNIEADDRVDEKLRLLLQGCQAVISIPLVQNGVWMGLLIFYWGIPYEFSPEDLEIYQALPALATPAVQNRRLVDNLEQLIVNRTVDLRESEQRNLALLDAIPDMIFLIDQDGICLDARIPQKSRDLDTETVIGGDLTQILPNDVVSPVLAYIEKTLATRTMQTYEFQQPLQDGITAYYEARLMASNNREVIVIIRDITNRKRAELVLKEAKNAAEAANRAKSEFLASISHELRTPLNGILGYTQIMQRDTSLGEQQRHNIAIIEQSGEHLLNLINDILDLSKVEAGRLELVKTEFPLSTFLKNMVDVVQVRAIEKGITFYYEPVSTLPEAVYGDETRLRQVLINLLGNAVKFTKEGEVTFTVKPTVDNKILFDITDTGVGIASEELDEIFLPFKQVGKARSHTEGTGLGLSISKRLVEAMGGSLTVSSTLGKGATFCVELVLPPAKTWGRQTTTVDTQNGSFNSTLVQGYQRHDSNNPIKILVVDDKSENRTLVIDLLRPLGFEIYEAIDGQKAITMAPTIKPDLILMDLIMPDISGQETTRQLRANPALQKSIIIAVSASAFEHDRQSSQQAGCNDFIAKPIQLDNLLKVIEKYLPLHFIYRASTQTTAPNTPKVTNRYIVPSQTELKTLFEFAVRGNFKGFNEQLALLKNADEALLPFITDLEKLAQKYKMRQIRRVLRKYME